MFDRASKKKRTILLGCRVSAEEDAIITGFCETRGFSRSDVLRLALKSYFKGARNVRRRNEGK